VTPLLLYFTTRYAVVFPAIIVEGLSGNSALRRSWSITARFGWHVAQPMLVPTALALLIGVGKGLTASHIHEPLLLFGLGGEATWAFLWRVGQLLVLEPVQALIGLSLYYDLCARTVSIGSEDSVLQSAQKGSSMSKQHVGTARK
jgi:hypothetical protein